MLALNGNVNNETEWKPLRCTHTIQSLWEDCTSRLPVQIGVEERHNNKDTQDHLGGESDCHKAATPHRPAVGSHKWFYKLRRLSISDAVVSGGNKGEKIHRIVSHSWGFVVVEEV